MMFRTVTIAALVGFVSAFSLKCTDGLFELSRNSDVYACLRPTLLFPILFGVGNSPESIVSYLDKWLSSPEGMCSSPACAPETVDRVMDTIHEKCSAEFATTLPALDYVRDNYRSLRKIACLKDGPVNCITDTLSNIESFMQGNLNLDEDNIKTIISSFKEGPSKVLCTKCTKGFFTLGKDIPRTFSKDSATFLKDTCGPPFVDGGIPPGLIASASESTAIPVSGYATTTTLVVPTTSTTLAPTSTLRPKTTKPTPTHLPTSSPTNENAAVGAPYLSSSAIAVFLGLILAAAEAF